MAIKSIKLDGAAGRILIAVFAVLCAAAAVFFAKWFLAHTIASRVGYVEDQRKEIAALAVGWAPGDPQAHFVAGAVLEKTFLPSDWQQALREYEQAVALSPHDYRLWFELGRARDRSGDPEGAEVALRRARELAPNYSQVRWTFGNFLLRQGRTVEAFEEIRRAVEGNQDFAEPAVSVAWQVFEGDIDQVRQHVGDSVQLNAALAVMLARDQRFDEALRIWSGLPATARGDLKTPREAIYQKLLENKRYRTALQIFGQVAGEGDKVYRVGEIANGGFEEEVAKPPTVFGWQIADGAEPLVGVDNANKRGGSLSLGIVFRNPDGRSFRDVSQTVAVEPGRRYIFEAFYKSDLKASATLKWEAVDASNDGVLASTESVAATQGWTNLRMEFTVPAGSEGVTIRLVRAGCAAAPCPISGRIWFDDVSLNAAGA